VSLPRQYFLRNINFKNTIENQHSQFIPAIDIQTNAKSIQSIIDSVSLAELYLTEEHLTGISPYWINGQEDSMQSRYSYSPQIYKAQAYLESRFEDYGYTVEYLPFAMGTFYDIQFVPAAPSHGWLVTVDKIFGTQNSGLSWTLQYEGTSGGDIWSWLFGWDGLQLVAFHLINYLDESQIITYDIYFVNDSTGWSVGRSGTIIYTNDYGESWTLQSTPTSERLYGVYFKDENEGFAVGWNGTVLHTTNGGTNWSSASTPLNVNFYDIDFIDQNTGMIVGWDGACVVTTDGGTTWTFTGNIFLKDIYGFDLINANDVWASGAGIVTSSSDFGANWTTRMDSIPSGSLINLIATKTGTQYPDQHYIVCAHYDAITYTTPMTFAPGADDNGSGTAAVIEAARIFKDYDFDYSVKFILFPGEEQGLHGSQAYASNAAATGEQILGVLNMDMIGYDGNNDGLVEIHAGTIPASQTIGSLMSSNITNFGLSLIPEYKTSNSSTASDHSPFWDHGFAAIMHIEDFQDFTPFYHTDGDVLSTMNQPYFLDNAKLTIGTLAQLAVLDTTSISSVPTKDLIPNNFVLYNPYPNPFNPTINIEYDLFAPDNVSIKIYDVLGKVVKNIVTEYQTAGNYKFTWDGKNLNNQSVSSGIYLMEMNTLNKNTVKKLMLMR